MGGCAEGTGKGLGFVGSLAEVGSAPLQGSWKERGRSVPPMWATEAKERMVEVCSHRTTRVPWRDQVSRKLSKHEAGGQQTGRVQ